MDRLAPSVVSCLKPVSKVHRRRGEMGIKSFFINLINWTFKCHQR